MSAINEEELQTAVHAALVQWGKPVENETEPLSKLQLVQNQLALNQGEPSFGLRHAVDLVLLENIERLAAQDETGAKVLQKRFLDGKISRQVAQEMHASLDQINRWQRTAISRLSQVLYQQEMRIRAEWAQALAASLPPASYSQFFGFTQARQTIGKQLVSTAVPWIAVITGIGGIGKTSLADFVVREALPSLAYKRLCWLRVENQQLSGDPLPPESAYEALLSSLAAQVWPGSQQSEPLEQLEKRLCQALKTAPHLVVVDNLETTTHVDYVAAKLLAFTEPSRFLLTSRARPSGETAVYIHSLQELPFNDAAALLRQHARITGLEELSEADDQTMAAVYEVTGGNPLALKLVVSLTAVLPLPQILADLSKSRVGPIEDLYRHIYWQTWRTLTPPAQNLLQAMPLAAVSGALPQQMQAMSELDDDDFWAAIRELTTRSLLEVQGTIQERRYGIHRLTETFLHTEIIRWPEMLE
jgi:hypothetical protein